MGDANARKWTRSEAKSLFLPERIVTLSVVGTSEGETRTIEQIPPAVLDEEIFGKVARVMKTEDLYGKDSSDVETSHPVLHGENSDPSRSQTDEPFLVIDISNEPIRAQISTFLAIYYPVTTLMRTAKDRLFFVHGDHSEYLKSEILKIAKARTPSPADLSPRDLSNYSWCPASLLGNKKGVMDRLTVYHEKIGGRRAEDFVIPDDETEVRSLIELSGEHSLIWTHGEIFTLLTDPVYDTYQKKIVEDLNWLGVMPNPPISTKKENSSMDFYFRIIRERERSLYVDNRVNPEINSTYVFSFNSPLHQCTGADNSYIDASVNYVIGGWLNRISLEKTVITGEPIEGVIAWWSQKNVGKLRDWIDLRYPSVYTVHSVPFDGTDLPRIPHLAIEHHCSHVCENNCRDCPSVSIVTERLEEIVKTAHVYLNEHVCHHFIRRRGRILSFTDLGERLNPINFYIEEGGCVVLNVIDGKSDDFQDIANEHFDGIRSVWPRVEMSKNSEREDRQFFMITSPSIDDYIDGFRTVIVKQSTLNKEATRPLPMSRCWKGKEPGVQATISCLESYQSREIRDHYQTNRTDSWFTITLAKCNSRGFKTRLPYYNNILASSAVPYHLRPETTGRELSTGFFNALHTIRTSKWKCSGIKFKESPPNLSLIDRHHMEVSSGLKHQPMGTIDSSFTLESRPSGCTRCM